MWPFTRAAPPPRPRREPSLLASRGYVAARADRLLADIPTWSRSADADIRAALRPLRARARHLAQNDDYARGFLKLLRRHVVGPAGIALQMRVPMERGGGRQDADANDKIETAWWEWTRKGTPTIDGRLSFTELLRQVITVTARDGEVFLRHVNNWRGNRFGYAVQVIAPDQLDETLNGGPGQAVGNFRIAATSRLRMGIEQDEASGRPIAYHFLTSHPGDDAWSAGGRIFQRVPAEDVLHVAIADEDVAQSRGVTWFATAIMRLAMLHGYEKAELVAARISAAKVGFYKNIANPEDVPHDASAANGLVQDVEPGSFEPLPPGVELESWDPQHPNTAFGDFVKGVLRGAATGLGVSYNTLSGDLESVNYSSLRQGALEDRDEWRVLQGWLVESVCERVFTRWLLWSLTRDVLGLPLAKIARFDAPSFVARGWQWVDPAKEIEATEREIAAGLTSRTRVCAKLGVEFEEILKEQAAETALAKQYGVDLAAFKPASSPMTPPPVETPKESDDA